MSVTANILKVLQARINVHSERVRWAILITPSLVGLTLFFVAPLAQIFVVSLRSSRFGLEASPLTLVAYGHFLGEPFYRAVLGRTLLMSGGVASLCLMLSYPLAYAMARGRSRWLGLLNAVVLIPLMTNIVVRNYGWTILFAGGGPVNASLRTLGLPPIRLLFTFAGVVVSLTEVLMPFMVLTLVGVLQQIDEDLMAAVRSLGGTRWHVFRDIVWPLSLPGVAAGWLLVFVLSAGSFVTPMLIGGSRIQVVATLVYTEATTNLAWPFASAMSFVLVALVIMLMLLQNRLLQRARTWVA